ncbi:MAG: hypothetical protein GXP23_06505, partial [Gammaproteobacteria bacterium]|nr:hypothetical protein [Gammaproteobacteria bacterium]
MAESKSRPPWFDLPTHNLRQQLKNRRHGVVVGAGIAGITTACALAKRGWT